MVHDPTNDRLELFFSQSLDGFFFMMLDEPIAWNDRADKEALLDYALDHHRVTKANDAMLRQYGASPDQFIGITPRQLFAHDLGYARRVWREFFDRGRLHVETEERRLDGDPVFIEGDYICLYDADGRITGHFGIQRDVTERRRAVEQRERELEMLVAVRTAELAISEHRLRAILSALPDLVFLVDEDGRYLEILSAASPLLAKSAEELKGRLFHDIFPKPTADAFLNLVRATLQGQTLQTMEYQLTVPAGDRWFEGRTAVLPVDITEKRCVVFTARDISDTKRAEELESQNVYLREELNLGRSFGDIVGASEAMRAVFKSIEMVAPTDSTVLILGETGTGKELMACAIHESSRRRRGVMVKVNCAALPPSLVESELFGHERGAFTGAVQQKKGRFELAHRGTIFLDEIGELPLEMQVQAASRAAGTGARATGRDADHQGRRPRRRGDESRSVGRRAHGSVSCRSVLPAEHLPGAHAAAARTSRRHPAARCALRAAVRRAHGETGAAHRARHARATGTLPLAGQRA